ALAFASWLLFGSPSAHGQEPGRSPSPPPVVPMEPADLPPPTPVLPGDPKTLPPPEAAPQPDAFAPSDRGFGGAGGLIGPVVGHMVPRADFRFAWFPNEAVRGQPTELGYTQYDVSLIVPVWQCPTDELSVSAHARAEFFTTSAILPNTLQPFP